MFWSKIRLVSFLAFINHTLYFELMLTIITTVIFCLWKHRDYYLHDEHVCCVNNMFWDFQVGSLPDSDSTVLSPSMREFIKLTSQTFYKGLNRQLYKQVCEYVLFGACIRTNQG